MPERALTIGNPPRVLEAMLSEPTRAEVRGGVVICHPHPEYGGSMDNTVVVAVARALLVDGMAVLRVNFGGVGRSRGAYSGGTEEVQDVRAALRALAVRVPDALPPVLVGYSLAGKTAWPPASSRAWPRRARASPPLLYRPAPARARALPRPPPR
jgi:alpha/beta superfamily hydrolase